MAGKGRCDLQRRLEGGDSQQEVVVLTLSLQNIDAERLAADGAASPALEAVVRSALATAAGGGVTPEHVAIALFNAAGAARAAEEKLGQQGVDNTDEYAAHQDQWDQQNGAHLGADGVPQDDGKVRSVAPAGAAAAPTLHIVVTPPPEGRAAAVVTALTRALAAKDATSFKASLNAGLAASAVTKELAKEGAVEATVVLAPQVRTAVYPKVQLGTKHGIPLGVFTMLESIQALDDCRTIQMPDGACHPTGTEAVNPDEIVWALKQMAEVFKDAQLGRIFTVVVCNLQKKDRRSCRFWASSIPPTALRTILYDNPIKQLICTQFSGVHQQQAQLQSYMATGKVCAVVGTVAGDVVKRWTEEFTPGDKTFLADAATKLGAWPAISVPLARGLWDRSSCRFIVIDGLARSQKTTDVGLATLRKCPADILRAKFKAPWLGGAAKEASFFYLYESFAELSHIASAEDLVECLIKAFTFPGAELKATLKAFLDDWDLQSKVKQDCIVSFVSECEALRHAARAGPESRSKCCVPWGTRKPEEPVAEPPSAQGTAAMVLDAVISAYTSTVETDRRSAPGSTANLNAASLGDMFEVALLAGSGDELLTWAKGKSEADPRAVELTRRFLRTNGIKHVSNILLVAAGTDKANLYDDASARKLLEGNRLWSHDGRKYGRFSKHIEVMTRRSPDDFTQIIRMFLQLDLACEAGGSWHLMQAVEGADRGCLAAKLSRFAPAGSALRAALADEVMRGLAARALKVAQVETLLGYSAFFCPQFQNILKADTAIVSIQGTLATDQQMSAQQQNLAFAFLEAVLKIVSIQKGKPDVDVPSMVAEVCGHCQNGGQVTWRLFGKVLELVLLEAPANTARFPTLAELSACARELGKAGLLLERKLEKGSFKRATELLEGTLKAIAAALGQTSPQGWAASLRSLDTVIFTLEYMGKEDLNLAMERFKLECRRADHRKRLLWDLLAAVNQVYTQPLTGNDMEAASAAKDMKEYIKKVAPPLAAPVWWRGVSFGPADWQIVLDVAGAAADCMQKRYNVIMIPHHTQMISMLMFAVRTCGVGMGGQASKKNKLPKTMLARVGTGEGKSLIIGMLAAFVAKKGLRAHVINDQAVLTRRDFQTNASLFEALGLTASCEPKELHNQACSIVYCSGDDIEAACLHHLTEGTSDQYEEVLKGAVLIVDEVDGMIFDKGPASPKDFTDREFSSLVSEWINQLETTGRIERDWDDFRAQGDFSAMIQRELETAYNEAFEKKEGKDFTERGKVLYMLDPKTHMVKEDGWALWLEVLRRNRTGTSISYKYTKAILCRLQCFMSYSCIFGLTGSLGQKSEKEYLLNHYDAVTFNVPFFLDTCRSDDGGKPEQGNMVTILGEDGDKAGAEDRKGTKGSAAIVLDYDPAKKMYQVDLGDAKGIWYDEKCLSKTSSGKRHRADIGPQEPVKGPAAQEEAVINMAAAKCGEVPVLVLAKNTDMVHRVAQRLRAVLGPAYGEGTGGVIELLHNPRNPKEFVDHVDLSTEPLPYYGADGAVAGYAWRVAVTTAEGGRGHDYRVVDPKVDDNGGLLLILTWVPWSEREWIQFLGRTGRQDRAGQYAVLLDAEDEQVKSVASDRKRGETLPQTILRRGDMEAAKKLIGMADEINRARLMHKLTTHYWIMLKQELTNKKQDWEWKRLCQEYTKCTPDLILKRFGDIVPDRDWVAELELEQGPNGVEFPTSAATPRDAASARGAPVGARGSGMSARSSASGGSRR